MTRNSIISSFQLRGRVNGVIRTGWRAILPVLFFLAATPIASATNIPSTQVIAQGCASIPDDFALSEFWNSKMNVIEAWCDHPEIAQSSINGQRKPRAYADGSANVPHDAYAATLLNGDGVDPTALGTAPNSRIEFGPFCNDPSDLIAGEVGDVAFSLRAWADDCRLKSDLLPTTLIFGKNNAVEFVGNDRVPYGIQISSGSNYGEAIDYFTPGGSNILIGTGNVSYGLPEFAGIVAALNTALIAEGFGALTIDMLKQVLDASSDEVYAQVNGARNIYKESQVPALRQNSTFRYYGQIVNLSNAINQALAVAAPPPSEPDTPSSIVASDGTSTSHVATNWSASTDATQYKLYRCLGSDVGTCGSAIYTGPGTSYNDAGAVPGVTYNYQVQACNIIGCSNHSNGDDGYRAISPPSSPTSINASDGTSPYYVATSWSASNNATYYQLYRCSDATTATCGSPRYSGSATSFNDSGAVSGVTYVYRAKACNSAGCSAFSAGNQGHRDFLQLDNIAVMLNLIYQLLLEEEPGTN